MDHRTASARPGKTQRQSCNREADRLVCYHHWPEEFNQDRECRPGRAFHQSASGLVIPGPGPLRYESDQ